MYKVIDMMCVELNKQTNGISSTQVTTSYIRDGKRLNKQTNSNVGKIQLNNDLQNIMQN